MLLIQVVLHANGLEISHHTDWKSWSNGTKTLWKCYLELEDKKLSLICFFPGSFLFIVNYWAVSFVSIAGRKSLCPLTIGNSGCAHSTSAMRPLQGSLAGKTKVNNSTVRCRALDKRLTHESKPRVSHPKLPDSGLTQEQPGNITVRLENLTVWTEVSSLAMSVIPGLPRTIWLPALSKEVKKIN